MADLFRRTEVDFGGAMHAQNGIVADVNGVRLGILMQNMQINYQQQVTRLYELGSAGTRSGAAKTKVYYVSGRAQGTFQAAHVIGPGSILVPFYKSFGDVCKAVSNNLTITVAANICVPPAIIDQADALIAAGLPDQVTADFDAANLLAANVPAVSPSKWTMKFCVLTQIGMAVAAQDFVINSNSSIMFSGMDIS